MKYGCAWLFRIELKLWLLLRHGAFGVHRVSAFRESDSICTFQGCQMLAVSHQSVPRCIAWLLYHFWELRTIFGWFLWRLASRRQRLARNTVHCVFRQCPSPKHDISLEGRASMNSHLYMQITIVVANCPFINSVRLCRSVTIFMPTRRV